ncbi:hypothetical protein FSP39_006708 [Pinctada imbricata]|uniref:F5/8 type C domain-containing protein n=1 Tax=Pinctada imbricata TaxID=66713 RepID=A0AA88XXJ0_PINIB|nr:hypothetical protein FSP39_006708 [Pinctada imbricata]
MFDVALKSAGASVVLASSSDEKYPPENIIDGNSDTFWSSTGLFPQEVVITYTSMMRMSRIEIACYNVKNVMFQYSKDIEPLNFQDLFEKELDSTDGQLQLEEFPVNNVEAQHLRVVIESGHDHFVSIHKLTVNGTAIHG